MSRGSGRSVVAGALRELALSNWKKPRCSGEAGRTHGPLMRGRTLAVGSAKGLLTLGAKPRETRLSGRYLWSPLRSGS